MLELASTDYIILLTEVMIVAGALGGMMSAILTWKENQPFFSHIIKHALTGIVMAMTVPLILNTFSSDLLDVAQAKPLKLFTLSGLCIFVALFSTGILERICNGHLRHGMQNCQNQVHQCGEEPDIKRENIRPAAALPGKVEEIIPRNQLKILETLAGVEGVKMTLADLLRHTMIPQKDFDEAISLMKAKGLVVQELSGGRKPMLILTTRGRKRVLTEFPLRAGHY